MYYFDAHDSSTANIYGGEVSITLGADANSIVNVYSSDLIEKVSLWDNSTLNLYAYNVVHHATGGYSGDGWIEGKYILDDSQFIIDLIGDSFSHINIIPEPTTFALLQRIFPSCLHPWSLRREAESMSPQQRVWTS